MDDDRKYKQRGYQEHGHDSGGRGREDRPRQSQGPRPPLDVTGPRLPRMVQSVTAVRCWNCATTLPAATVEVSTTCPKCNSALHCCKQCAHFEPSTRFQCLKPIPERLAYKDQVNQCTLFSSRVTVARDANVPITNGSASSPPISVPRSSADARLAFDNLFKK
jgi:hypothetical protein